MNYRTSAPQYIPKSGNYKVGFAFSFSKVVYIKLGNSFCCPHYVSWINRFIGRNHNKLFNIILVCCIYKMFSSFDIGSDCFVRVLLHKWHMLIGRCMKNDVWLEYAKNTIYPIVITNITNYKLHIYSILFYTA